MWYWECQQFLLGARWSRFLGGRWSRSVICFGQENNGEDVVDNLGGRSSQKVFGKVNRQILGEFNMVQLTCLMETYNNGNIYPLVNVYIANWKDPLFVCLPEAKAWFPKGVCPPRCWWFAGSTALVCRLWVAMDAVEWMWVAITGWRRPQNKKDGDSDKHWLVVKKNLWKIWKSVGVTNFPIWENKKCSKSPTRTHLLNLSKICGHSTNNRWAHKFWHQELDGVGNPLPKIPRWRPSPKAGLATVCTGGSAWSWCLVSGL